MRLFNPDAYIIVTTNEERLDLSAISEKTKRRLNLSFNCFLTKDSEPNDGECTIYNLSETSRNKISEGDKVELFAGYDGKYKLISVGDISNVQNRNPATEWQTRIEWGDGKKQYLEATISKSYKEGVSLKDILNDLTNSLDYSVKGVIDELKEKINGGLSINGKTKDILNKITKDYGLEWSIQDEEVTVIKKGAPIDNEAIVISQETGLLEFPQVSNRGIDFITQLNPDLRPNKLVDIRSIGFFKSRSKPTDKIADKANGINIIETVRFVGDNFGGEFSAKVNCREYNG